MKIKHQSLRKRFSLSQHNSVNTNVNSQNSSHYNSSEKRVIRQLIEALLFEGIVPFELNDDTFLFSLEDQQYKATGKMSGFGRVRLDQDSLVTQSKDDSQQWQAIDLAVLVSVLPTTTVKKDTLSIQLLQTIKLCQWNQAHLSRGNDRRGLDYVALEAAIDEGHPYHPCFKARTGFSLSDHERYGPESAKPFQLDWLAVRRSVVKQWLTMSSDPSDYPLQNDDCITTREAQAVFWQNEIGLKTWSLLQARLLEASGNEQAYTLLPIHPWQWQNLQSALATPLALKHFIYLGTAGDCYQPSISVRTLLNVTNPERANIKLPLNMVNTSSLRTLDNHSICMAPVLSHWLNTLVEGDDYLQQHLAILPEYAGIGLQTSNSEQDAEWISPLMGQLGVIFRQSLAALDAKAADSHEVAPLTSKQSIPFVALSLIEDDGLPFIDPWIQAYGCETWVEKLIDISILPIWHLLVHHGISLEAHGQNLILEHQAGLPSKIVLRDFHESLEYVPNYMSDPSNIPDFKKLEPLYQTAKPNQYYWMEDVEALRELLIDTLFVYNLADLAVMLESAYQFSEKTFWDLVNQGFARYYAANLTAQARIDQIDIYQPTIQTESLIKKKLSEATDPNTGIEAEFHHNVNNPLVNLTKASI